MKKTSFDLDYLKHRRQDSDNPWRRVCIFAVIAAAVGTGIYFLIPRGDSADPAAEVPSAETLPSAAETAALPLETAATELPVDSGDPETVPNTAGESSAASDLLEQSDPAVEEITIAPDALEPGGFAAESAAIAALLPADPAAAQKRAERYLPRLSYSSEQWRTVAKLLTRANMQLLSQNGSSGAGTTIYTIRSGDSLSRIAARYNITVAELRRLNGIAPDNDRLYVGRTLKVPGGESRWSLEISRRTHLLKVLNHRKLFAVYDIGIGRIGRDTPEGKFFISEKIKDPDYTAPDGRILSAGEKDNQLGSRWRRLAPVSGADALQGYGIHGTPDENSVTQSLSNGCIRMRKADVETLFEIIPIGTSVTIEE